MFYLFSKNTFPHLYQQLWSLSLTRSTKCCLCTLLWTLGKIGSGARMTQTTWCWQGTVLRIHIIVFCQVKCIHKVLFTNGFVRSELVQMKTRVAHAHLHVYTLIDSCPFRTECQCVGIDPWLQISDSASDNKISTKYLLWMDQGKECQNSSLVKITLHLVYVSWWHCGCLILMKW